jgi:hypothetical protein
MLCSTHAVKIHLKTKPLHFDSSQSNLLGELIVGRIIIFRPMIVVWALYNLLFFFNKGKRSSLYTHTRTDVYSWWIQESSLQTTRTSTDQQGLKTKHPKDRKLKLSFNTKGVFGMASTLPGETPLQNFTWS